MSNTITIKGRTLYRGRDAVGEITGQRASSAKWGPAGAYGYRLADGTHCEPRFAYFADAVAAARRHIAARGDA